MPIKRPIIAAFTLVALAATPTLGARSAPLKNVPRSGLQVTEGTLAAYGHKGQIRTRDAAMRAVVRGHDADRARVSFNLLGPSKRTSARDAGIVHRRIGLRLLAANPCNLVNVTWQSAPTQAIEVQVKTNPAQTTSAQCANSGYDTIAVVPLTLPVSATRTHTLEATVRPVGSGAVYLRVLADRGIVWEGALPAVLVAEVRGSVGVRSDMGDYAFRLSTGR
jgi:hypothetical protein